MNDLHLIPTEPVRLTLSVKEVAAALGICPASVRAMITAGDLPAFRAGGRILIPRAQFGRWIERKLAAQSA